MMCDGKDKFTARYIVMDTCILRHSYLTDIILRRNAVTNPLENHYVIFSIARPSKIVCYKVVELRSCSCITISNLVKVTTFEYAIINIGDNTVGTYCGWL